MNKEKYCGGLDWFRLIAAALVIAIHTSPLTSIDATADFILTRAIARVAVPFFFMATGFFVLPGACFGSEAGMKKIVKSLKKITALYGIAILLYLPVGIYAGHFTGIHAGELLRMLLVDGTFYHLWYFPAVLTGLVVVYFLSKKVNVKIVGIICIALYVVGLLGDSYYGISASIPTLANAYDFGFELSSYTRNGLLYAPLFLVMGALLATSEKRVSTAVNGILFALTLGLMITEALVLRQLAWQRHDSMYVMLPVCMYFLFQFLRGIKVKSVPQIRTITTWMYVLHPLAIVLVRGGAKVLRLTTIFVDYSYIHYVAVVILTFILSFAISLLPIYRKKPYNDKRVTADTAGSRAWITIDMNALKHNVETLNALLPVGCELMPAVKANAYGHGAVLVSKALNRFGVRAFCVATAAEGVELRQAGIKGTILVLGYTEPSQFDLLRTYHLTQTVVDYAYALLLEAYGRDVKVHVGLDTGMHRLGEDCANGALIRKIFGMKHLHVTGVFSHLCTDDTDSFQDREFTKQQADNFERTIRDLEAEGFACGKVHILSSYGLMNYPEFAGDYARIGIALYGVLSTYEDTRNCKADLRPILTLEARVASVKHLRIGEGAGYGLDYVAQKDSTIAILSIGYADGLPRTLSCGKGAVLIHGKRATIIGRICMDQTMVDVTDIPAVTTGDVAVLIGTQGAEEISVCEMAERAGTITNEILSRMGERLVRISADG